MEGVRLLLDARADHTTKNLSRGRDEGVQGLGFKGLGFQGLGFRVQGLGFKV